MGDHQAHEEDYVYDVIIIGGGVVGLAALRAATLAGWTCALVEKEDRKSTRLNSSHVSQSRMPSSA